MNWALEQKVGISSVKFLLVAIATYCDEQGLCWPSQSTLARDTDQSVDSVQRGLHKLQAMGFIYLGPRRVSSIGHAGTREVVVLCDLKCRNFALTIGYDPQEIARKYAVSIAKNRPADENSSEENQKPQSAVSGFGEGEEFQQDSAGETDRSRNLRHQEIEPQKPQIAVSADTATVRYQEQPLLESFPLKSPKPSPEAALEEHSWLAHRDRFMAEWPWSPGELPERVWGKFRELDAEQRIAAIEKISAYLAECRRCKRQPMKARSWIGGRGWEPFVLAAKKRQTAGPGTSQFAIKGSPPYEAWKAYRNVRSFPDSTRMIQGKQQTGWSFPTLWPPGAVAERDEARAPPDVASGRQRGDGISEGAMR